MQSNDQNLEDEDYLNIGSAITDSGITISVKGKTYAIEYPQEVWKRYPNAKKKILLENIPFMQTCHLPASHKKKGAIYNTALPMFEPFAFKSTMLDIPSTAVIDHEKTVDYMKEFFNVEFRFSSYDSSVPIHNNKKQLSRSRQKTAVILFTAGKESLLNLALCIELGIRPILVYMDEAPGAPESAHKYKIIETIENEYGIKTHKIRNEPGKLRYCDLGEEANNWGAGTQFLTYVLIVQPFVDRFNADYILFGNEYSCDDYTFDKEGFKSNFCFDQCSGWTKQLNVVANMMAGNGVTVGSLAGPLYELALIQILHGRYPKLAKLQMSCFSDTPEGKDNVWCGHCSKCARMFVFFKALGIDTAELGFKNNMFNKPSMGLFSMFGTKDLYSYDVSGLGVEEQALAFYLSEGRGEKGYLIDEFRKLSLFKRTQQKIVELKDKYFSRYESIMIPKELEHRVMAIFKETLGSDFSPQDFRLKQVIEEEQKQSDVAASEGLPQPA
ncbi:MAG: hypothetical protein V1729_00665 [Candidatus Woesearchaeota archaeon]